jgi:hypothetical protein
MAPTKSGHHSLTHLLPLRSAQYSSAREQHGHVRGLAGVPCLNEFYRILDDLLPKRAARSRFLLRDLAASIVRFALVKAHGRASMSASRTGLKGTRPTADNPRYQLAQLAAAVIIGIAVAIVILIFYHRAWL